MTYFILGHLRKCEAKTEIKRNKVSSLSGRLEVMIKLYKKIRKNSHAL